MNNEQLQQKLVQLARRIMKLEDALSSLHEIHSRCASAGSYPGTSLQWDVLLPHPLLTVENRKIKDLSELSISVRILENLQMTSEDGSIPYLAEPVVALDHLHASFLEKSMSMSETIVIGAYFVNARVVTDASSFFRLSRDRMFYLKHNCYTESHSAY